MPRKYSEQVQTPPRRLMRGPEKSLAALPTSPARAELGGTNCRPPVLKSLLYYPLMLANPRYHPRNLLGLRGPFGLYLGA